MRAWLPLAGWAVALAGFVGLPLVVADNWVYLTTDFLIMALFAMSYNLLFGRAGMLSFGHAAFYGLGAYTVALLQSRLGINVLPGILAAPVVAGLAALVIGYFSVRLSGMYFGILTMSFSQLVYTVVFAWYDFTGGDNGLSFEPPDYLLDGVNDYYFTLAFVAVSIALLRLISFSPFGQTLAAIRENPARAAFIGLNVRAYQLAAFVIAGAFAGVAGGLRAPGLQLAFPSMLYWTQSADPVLMSLAGGLNTFVGPVFGAALFVFLNFVITGITEFTLAAFGLLVLAIVLFLPGGIVGWAQAAWRGRRPHDS